MERLFEAGLGKSPGELEALLQDCDDTLVRQELARLWAELPEIPPTFLSVPAPQPLPESRNLLAPGQTVANRFTVLSLIGEGGMGEVYRARDERLERIVALKVLRFRFAAGEADRLEREARTISSLSHPRICALHDLETDGGQLCLVMEYIEGETLADRLRRGPVPQPEALDLALQICAGLRHAHQQGVVHLDLKPSNVMIGAFGAKLLDFGIASRGAFRKSPAGAMGTPKYMSPEQAAGASVDARSDIYSFGLLLCEMLAGKGAATRVSAARPSTAADLQRLLPDLPRRLATLLARCLQQDPELRYQHAGDLEPALAALAAPPRPGTVRARWLGAAAALVTLATLAGFLIVQGNSDPGPMRPVPITSYEGVEYDPSLSPDGREVAFMWDGLDRDHFNLYAQAVKDGVPRRLTNNPLAESSPRWSPDGAWIAFARESALYLISPSGGLDRKIADLSPPSSVACGHNFGWAPDSHSLFFVPPAEPGSPTAVHRINIHTGATQQVTRPPAEVHGDFCPQVSPDNRQLLFIRRPRQRTPMFHVATLSPQLEILSERPTTPVRGTTPTWAPNSRELIFSFNTQAGVFLHRAPIDREADPQPLPFGEEGIYPVISRTGNRLAYMRRVLDVDIWRIPLGPAGPGAPTRMFVSSRWDVGAQYSPDGRQIAFLTNRSGPYALWVASADGTGARRIAERAMGVIRWSPDGSRIAYTSAGGIYSIPAAGGQPERIIGGGTPLMNPAWSRDGQWIYYSSEQTGRPEIWRAPAAGGRPQQVTTTGGSIALESFDGRHLYWIHTEGRQPGLYCRPVQGGPVQRVSDLIVNRAAIAASPHGLYFIPMGNMDGNAVVALHHPDSGDITHLFELPVRRRWTNGTISLSPDLRSLLYAVYDMRGDLMLIENFR